VLIWLASYPRSGNTLLRQVLWQTMGRGSFEDVPYRMFMGDWALNYEVEFGSLTRLLEEASTLDEAILVKTHLLPQDGERAVYVVRDGRSALLSFLRHQRLYEPQTEPTLTGLILGDHFYGGWSEHLRAWRDRPGETLVVRFGDLRNGDAVTLARLAEFVGNTSAIAPWVNRLEEYRRLAPNDFGEGRASWEPTEEWDWLADALFWAEHGDVMGEFGFDDGRRIVPPVETGLASVLDLARDVRRLHARVVAMTSELVAKEAMVQALDTERTVQGRAAAERATALERLTEELERLRSEPA
jgi:Sulfotransferase domain